MTKRSAAINNAKQAVRLLMTHGKTNARLRNQGGEYRYPWIWSDDNGYTVILNSLGAVNATATKRANIGI